MRRSWWAYHVEATSRVIYSFLEVVLVPLYSVCSLFLICLLFVLIIGTIQKFLETRSRESVGHAHCEMLHVYLFRL